MQRLTSRLGAAAGIWTLVVIAGLLFLCDYHTRPGRVGTPAVRWPVGSRIRPDADRATLVMVAHPLCPCTAASVEELARIMAQGKDQVSAYVLAYTPQPAPPGWEQRDLRGRIATIPGVCFLEDIDGREATLFEGLTSGQVSLYDRDGRLRFLGGITPARGHEGHNDGQDAVVALISGGRPDRTTTPIFGCPLFDDDPAPRRGHAR